MIKHFIKDQEFQLDLGKVYEYILLNQNEISSELSVKAFYELDGYLKSQASPSLPFNPFDWKYVKEELEIYQKNNLSKIPNKFSFRKTEYDITQLSEEKQSQLHYTTGKDLGEGGTEYNGDAWKPYQFDIYNLTNSYILEWDDSELCYYWISWYLTLLDESCFSKDFLTSIATYIGKPVNETISFINNLHVERMNIFRLSDWEGKKKGLSPSKNHESTFTLDTGKTMKVNRPVSREKGDTLTDLTATQTNLLFRYLQQSGIIIRDQNIQSNLNLAKLVCGLTGYNIDSLRGPILETNKKDQRKIIEKLKKCINLINKDLE